MDTKELKSTAATIVPPEPSSTIGEFCSRRKISAPTFYKMLDEGKGPRIHRIGRSPRISFEAERDWVKEREAEFAKEAESVEAQRRKDHARRIASLSVASDNHISKRRKKRAD